MKYLRLLSSIYVKGKMPCKHEWPTLDQCQLLFQPSINQTSRKSDSSAKESCNSLSRIIETELKVYGLNFVSWYRFCGCGEWYLLCMLVVHGSIFTEIAAQVYQWGRAHSSTSRGNMSTSEGQKYLIQVNTIVHREQLKSPFHRY